MNYSKGFIPIVLVAIIAGGVLVAGGGTYTGVTYYQSNKLIKEADKLVAEGKYADAVTKYDKAKKKWRWAKIETKKSDAEILNKEEDLAKEGETNFGKGEWQKCLEYLGQVTSKYPKYEEIQTRYSDCQKKLDEQNIAEAQKTANGNSTQTTTKKKTAATSAVPPASSTSQPTTKTPPTLYLPYSTGGILPSAMTPMGETLYHPKPQNPQGHPGIDFQWENPSGVPTITASMDATITEIKADDFWVGAYAVSTKNGSYGVDYTELGGVSTNLKVGDTVKAGDTIGTPQHPASITDQPNFRMIHWQFGTIRDERYGTGVGTRLCPLSYFASSARSAIENLWANTNATELKANAPDICSGDYK